MTVLGLLLASFITQGQQFLPTFSTLVTTELERVQQCLFSNQRLSKSNSIAQTSHQFNFSSVSLQYQKEHSIALNKISCQGSHNSIKGLQEKVAFSPVLKTASINAKPLPFLEKSFKLIPRKEWDMPQTPYYDAEQRLLAQYYQGRALPVLRYGNTGSAVRVLQTLLTYNRYGVRITGRFDVLTETAVKAFQANRRLKADGIVGYRTWQELTRYVAFHTKKDSMEIPMFGNQPLYPWQRSFRGNFAESLVSI